MIHTQQTELGKGVVREGRRAQDSPVCNAPIAWILRWDKVWRRTASHFNYFCHILRALCGTAGWILRSEVVCFRHLLPHSHLRWPCLALHGKRTLWCPLPPPVTPEWPCPPHNLKTECPCRVEMNVIPCAMVPTKVSDKPLLCKETADN